MTDDAALAWKLGFGALVLLFSATAMLLREEPQATPVAAPATAAPTPLAPATLRPASQPAPLEALDPVPLDVQEEEAPVRIEVTLFEPRPPRAQARRPPAQRAPAKPAKHASAPRPRPVLVKLQGPHYPYRPGERLHTAEQDFAPGR